MNFKKISIILCTIIITSTFPTTNLIAHAKDISAPSLESINYTKTTSNDELALINQNVVTKLDNYVEIDVNAKQFTITSSAYSQLDTEEVQILESYVHESNEIIKNEILKGKSITSNLENKSFKEVRRVKRSINTSKYWDWELCWWGRRLYFHNNFIEDMQRYAKSYAAGTILGASGAAWAAIELGGVAGPVGALVGAFVGYESAVFRRILF